MAERTFRVCDAPNSGGRGTCNERSTARCVSCDRDFCSMHRRDQVTIEIGVKDGGRLTAHLLGTMCHVCIAALNDSSLIAELFSPAREEILLRVRAHLSAEALKTTPPKETS